MKVNHALIPAAGRGSRLDCAHTVKPLVRLGGIPLIGWNIIRLTELGINKFTVVTGYRGALLEDRLSRLFPQTNLQFIHNNQWREGLGLSVLKGARETGESFVLTMSDHLFEKAIFQKLLEDPQEPVKLAVDHKLHEIYDLDDATRVNTEAGKITEIDKGLAKYNAVDTGLFLADNKLVEALEKAEQETGKSVTLSDGINKLITSSGVGAVDIGAGQWIDIDVPGALVRGEKMVDPDEVPWEETELTVRGVKQKQTTQETSIYHSTLHPTFHFTTAEEQLTEVFFGEGILENIDPHLLIPEANKNSPHVLITDATVYELYGQELEARLTDAGLDVQVLVAEEGEAGKSMESYEELVGLIFDRGIDAGSYIINLGGGCVCNVGGFIASTLYRGIGLVHIPTTLMGQCDAAIGIKQGLNAGRGKNQIGSYYVPEKILVDPQVLQTMDAWLFPDGLSECLKHALGQDREFFEFFLDHEGAIDEPDFLAHAVSKNIELKIELMNTDPKEKREGLVLQYGHTVGHAIEYLSSYQLGHGQSISIGMMAAAEIGRELGIVEEEVVDKHRRLLTKYDLPVHIPEDLELEDIVEMIRFNKRYQSEEMRFVLCSRIGAIHEKEGQYQFPVKKETILPALKQLHKEGVSLSQLSKK